MSYMEARPEDDSDEQVVAVRIHERTDDILDEWAGDVSIISMYPGEIFDHVWTDKIFWRAVAKNDEKAVTFRLRQAVFAALQEPAERQAKEELGIDE